MVYKHFNIIGDVTSKDIIWANGNANNPNLSFDKISTIKKTKKPQMHFYVQLFYWIDLKQIDYSRPT